MHVYLFEKNKKQEYDSILISLKEDLKLELKVSMK
jgi:hypothetical protein